MANLNQDDELFAEAMGKVNRITPANKIIPEKVKPKPEAAARVRQAHPLLRAEYVEVFPRQAEDPWVLCADGISRQRLRLFAAGRPPIELTLDLHGVIRNEALNLLENLLRRAINARARAVCIVHGRGLHSAGKPVLKETVYQWLRRGPFAHAVLAAIPRPGSGGGACLVLLRRA